MSRPHAHQADTVRIIGGQWRSRKLHFTEAPGLRPTPDRVRETLFNWLQSDIVNANCIDLFAGSGALGFEALSRGARQCLFVDSHRQCVDDIKHNLELFNAQGGYTSLNDALLLLKASPSQFSSERFDIAFIDPPYAMDCALQCCHLLVEQKWLADRAMIYIESSSAIEESQLPEHWRLHRQKKAGQVNYHLAIQEKPGPA